jgi:hypothetical protein
MAVEIEEIPSPLTAVANVRHPFDVVTPKDERGEQDARVRKVAAVQSSIGPCVECGAPTRAQAVV